MKYIEFDHPILRGMFEMYRRLDMWSMIGLTALYVGILLAIVAYVYTRRKQMTRRRWLYAIGSFVIMTAFFVASMIIPGNLKSGYYEGDVEVKKVLPITQTKGKQYGIISKTPIQPKQIQGLVIDKKALKKSKIEEGDTIHIKTEPTYKPTDTTSYVVIQSSDIKNVKKGN